MRSTFGKRLEVTIYGESHGDRIGTVIKGFPAGFAPDMDRIYAFMERRAPGRDAFSTSRREPDVPKVASGIINGLTDGRPLEAYIENTNQHSSDYDNLRYTPRPSHADLPARMKYGDELDLRGGGHFSGRLTAPLCFAGALCLQFLAARGITVGGHIYSIAGVKDRPFDPVNVSKDDFDELLKRPFPVLDTKAGKQMQLEILGARSKLDSVGGVIEVAVLGLPMGLGTPLYGGIESLLAANLFGVPAVKGVEFGSGFSAALMKGSENNDPYCVTEDGKIRTLTNNAGGVLGAITTGMPLIVRTAIKPTPSIALPQQTVDLRSMTETELTITGRHDPCIVPRAVPVIEAMTAITVTDMILSEV